MGLTRIWQAEGHLQTYKGGKRNHAVRNQLYNVMKNKGKEVQNIPLRNGNLVHSLTNTKQEEEKNC